MKEKDKKALMITKAVRGSGAELLYLIEWFNETELKHILELIPDELSRKRLIDIIQIPNDAIYPDREKLDKLYEILESNVTLR